MRPGVRASTAATAQVAQENLGSREQHPVQRQPEHQQHADADPNRTVRRRRQNPASGEQQHRCQADAGRRPVRATRPAAHRSCPRWPPTGDRSPTTAKSPEAAAPTAGTSRGSRSRSAPRRYRAAGHRWRSAPWYATAAASTTSGSSAASHQPAASRRSAGSVSPRSQAAAHSAPSIIASDGLKNATAAIGGQRRKLQRQRLQRGSAPDAFHCAPQFTQPQCDPRPNADSKRRSRSRRWSSSIPSKRAPSR